MNRNQHRSRSMIFIMALFLHNFVSAAEISKTKKGGQAAEESLRRPNVLFIIVDDLNDMPLHPTGKPFVPTPNFDRLAARGISFTNAHCNDPLCAPSRSSMMTGLYPQTSSLYWFEDLRENAILTQSVTMTEHFATNGYDVYGTGKIYHGNQDPNEYYAKRGPRGSNGPWPWDGNEQRKRALLPHPQQLYFYADDADPEMDYQWEHTFGPLSKIPNYQANQDTNAPGYRGWTLGGKPFHYASDQNRDAMPDEVHADWAASILREKHPTPFLLMTGFSRTHTPLYAPKEYFDRFPLDEIEIPNGYRDGDLKDCAPSLANQSLYAFRRYQMLFKHPQKPDLFKRWLQAYMACVSFIDDQVGTVLDALDKSEFSDNTLIILTSDHGFHVGGKEALYKQTLWDSGTRIPFIVSGLKGIPEGIKCQQPISLIDVYPTLIDICGLPENPNRTRNGYPLDGHSLKPLLHNTPDQWSGPDVAITALPGKDHSQHREHIGTLYPHFSVRSKDWRYSLTSDGQEELYHYPSDPYEFHNLAKEAQHNETKIELKRKLVTMRDGDQWLPFEYQTLEAFEITCEVKGQSKLVFDQRVITDVDVVDWTPLRIRVAGKRSQVWLDNRVHSDKLSEQPFNKSSVQFTATESRQLRIRNLFPSRTQ